MNAVRKPKKTAKSPSKTDKKSGGAKAPAAKTKVPAAKSAPASSTPVFSLEPIFAALRKRLPAARQAEAKAFAESFYKRMEDDEYPHHAPEAWAALEASMRRAALDAGLESQIGVQPSALMQALYGIGRLNSEDKP
jgi:glutamate dehydrogenase